MITFISSDNSGNVLDGSYSYDWQLSGDGGANWTTVATNADYKITTAEGDRIALELFYNFLFVGILRQLLNIIYIILPKLSLN